MLEPDSLPSAPAEPTDAPRSAAEFPAPELELENTEGTNADEAHHVPRRRRATTGRKAAIAKSAKLMMHEDMFNLKTT